MPEITATVLEDGRIIAIGAVAIYKVGERIPATLRIVFTSVLIIRPLKLSSRVLQFQLVLVENAGGRRLMRFFALKEELCKLYGKLGEKQTILYLCDMQPL